MDFLEDLFEIAERKRRKKAGSNQNESYHDDDHDSDHEHDHQHRSQEGSFSQVPKGPAAFSPGVICRRCSTQTIQGAGYCHGCGAAIQSAHNCSACGSKLAENAPFCPQCGYRNK
jgi:hypothetical protein